MGIHFITDWVSCFEHTVELLSSDTPEFLARIGGSDTYVIAEYLRLKSEGSTDFAGALKWINLVERYNGFYDKDKSNTTFLDYCEVMLQAYLSSRQLIFCNHQLLAMYFPNNVHSSILEQPIENRVAFELLIEAIRDNSANQGQEAYCYPYPYVEKLTRDPWTLFRAFSKTLHEKKVLVISPFAESIELNFPNRNLLFKNYVYPDFSLAVCNTPVTYGGLPPSFYPHRNWQETLEALKAEISTYDFDVALMACGSYAMPLGVHIAQKLNRKAVYVGGVLQMYFGILGRRYDNPFFTDQINREHFIWPRERKDFLNHIELKENSAHEAFGAYF